MLKQVADSMPAPYEFVQKVRSLVRSIDQSNFCRDEGSQGISRQELLDFRDGKTTPTLGKLISICLVIRCDVHELVQEVIDDKIKAAPDPSESAILKEALAMLDGAQSRRLARIARLEEVLFRLKRALSELEMSLTPQEPERRAKLLTMIEDCEEALSNPFARSSLLVKVAECLTRRIKNDIRNKGTKPAISRLLDCSIWVI